jgi:hypothetical protein
VVGSASAHGIRDRHGTDFAINQVPKPRPEAVATVLGNGAAKAALRRCGIASTSPYSTGAAPAFGMPDSEMKKINNTLGVVWLAAPQALARVGIGFLKGEIDELLKLLSIFETLIFSMRSGRQAVQWITLREGSVLRRTIAASGAFPSRFQGIKPPFGGSQSFGDPI